MKKVVNLQKAIQLSKQLKFEGKKIVLVGGCFDIFHFGHFKFLQSAKKYGDILFIALESDKRVSNLKGSDRPITPQPARAEILSSFPFVNYVILLSDNMDNKSYSKMTIELKPDIIAVTQGDQNIDKKQKQANATGAEIKVVSFVKTPSTSKILDLIRKEI